MSSKRFDLAVVLNYYAPYVSGLTEAARLLAEGFAARAAGWPSSASGTTPPCPGTR